MISPEATSDDLTDDMDHAYFLRMVSPDQYQARAMVDLLIHYDWSYFSLIYTSSVYGTNGANQIVRLSRDAGLCIGYSKALNMYMTSDDEFDHEMKNLQRYGKAKAVLLFTSVSHAKLLMKAAMRLSKVGEFIWIGADGVDNRAFKSVEASVVGALQFTFPEYMDTGFEEHFRSLTPWNNERNPWFHELWMNNFGCSFNISEDAPSHCSHFSSITDTPDFYMSGWTARSMDSIQVTELIINDTLIIRIKT